MEELCTKLELQITREKNELDDSDLKKMKSESNENDNAEKKILLKTKKKIEERK